MKEILLQALRVAYAGVAIVALVAYWPTVQDLLHRKQSANATSYLLWTVTSGIATLYSFFILDDVLVRIVSAVGFISCVSILTLAIRLRRNETQSTMDTHEVVTIVRNIVAQGLKAIKENTDERNPQLDYLGIFAKNDTEYTELERMVSTLGKPGNATATRSGSTFVLDTPLETPAGPLNVLKVRKPDPTRPQRGAPDFRVNDYASFKERYTSTGENSNFTLMVRKDYEMLELKGTDVLVYFPNKSYDERQG